MEKWRGISNQDTADWADGLNQLNQKTGFVSVSVPGMIPDLERAWTNSSSSSNAGTTKKTKVQSAQKGKVDFGTDDNRRQGIVLYRCQNSAPRCCL